MIQKHEDIGASLQKNLDLHSWTEAEGTATLIIPSDADKKSFGFEMAD